MINKNIFILMIFLALVLAVPCVFAIGITPGRTTINFESGLNKEIKLNVINSEAKNMGVALSVQGELAEYVTLSESNLQFLSNEESKDFIYNILLPESLSPGLHVAEIVALEIPETGQEKHIGASVAVISQIYVYVSCEGKCIESDFDIANAEQNNIARIIVPVVNRGKLDINSVSAVIEIYDKDEKIETISTLKNAIPAGGRTELTADWVVEIPNGEYIAKVIIDYDSEVYIFAKSFVVGKESLLIERILVDNFKLGEIAELRVLVENRLNQELKNVFANLLVYNAGNQIQSDIKSASEDIFEFAKKELIIYWNTVGINEGVYNGKLLVKYGQKSSDKQLVLKVSEDSLDITGVGFAINPQGGTGASVKTIIIVMIIILVITNLAWFVFFKRYFGKRKNQGKNNKGGVIIVKK